MLKALSIRQPWASLIVRAGKSIENRDWKTNYRGLVAVHASAKMTRADMEDACGLMRTFIPKFSAQRFEQDEFPLGAIIGTVEIVDCVTHSDSLWFCGEYGFVLRNPISFAQQVKCKGALGFWEVKGETLEQVREQFRQAKSLPPK